MSTEFINDQWRLPNEENKSKVSNYSMDFDGSSQYIDLGDSDTFSFGNGSTDSAFSFFIWAKFGNITTNCFISKQTNDTTNSEYQFWQSGDLMGITFAEGVGTRTGYLASSTTVSPSLTTGQWYHIGFTYAGGSNPSTGPIIYVNGVAQSMSYNISSYTAMSNNSAPLKIGELSGASPTYNFNGKLDHGCLFDYELSPSQVTTLWGGGTSVSNPMALPSPPIAYYPLGDQDAFNGANYLVPNSSLKDYVFDFDGSNDYIDLGNDVFFNTNNPFSFSTWVNLDSYSDPYPYLVNLKTNVTDGIAIFISNNSSYAGVNVGSTDSSITKGRTTGDISSTFLNSWNHVVVTYNGNGANTLSNYSIYVNGSSVTLTTTGNYSTMPNTANNIGRRSNSYHYLDGKMSNVQIFNTALPATGSNSVETLYNNGSPLTSMTGFTSLVSWWKLDASDTFNGTNWTIEDHAGSNDGTSSGMTQANLVQSDLSFKTSYSPYALDFDSASSDYIQINNGSSLTNGFSELTVSIWANFSSLSTHMGLISKDLVNQRSFDFRFISSSGVNLLISTDGVNNSQTLYYPTSNITTGVWYNFIGTYDGSKLSIYVNGSLIDDTITLTGSLQNTTSNLYVGTRGYLTSNSFNGKLSNASIWNTALTSAKVKELYSEGIPQNLLNHSAVSSLVSWWQLGSNSSFNTNWTVLDEKGSNNGTSANMGEDAIVDGVGSYANGTSSGMGGDEVIGDAPYSTANSLSVNMDVEDRVTDTPS